MIQGKDVYNYSECPVDDNKTDQVGRLSSHGRK